MTKTVLSFPRVGIYTPVFRRFLERLDIKVLPPAPVTDRTIRLGVKHSQDMICYPFKVTLGNFIEAIENGATHLVMYDTVGRCRLRHYWILHKLILEGLHYKFEMYPLQLSKLCKFVRHFNPGLSRVRIWREVRRAWKEIKKVEYEGRGPLRLNIGIIGEIYTCIEPSVNFNIIGKLGKLGVNVCNTVKLSDFIKEKMKLNRGHLRKYKKQAEKYLNGPLGGHGFQNIYYTLYLCDRKFDGLIYLMPLSCMPETTVEPIIKKICSEHGVPVLSFMIDETNSEVNFNTRIETFIELIRRKAKYVSGN